MKMYEILELSMEELEGRLEDKIEEIGNLRFQQATHQITNPMLLKTTRRDIAKIKTILNEYKKGIRIPKVKKSGITQETGKDKEQS